MVTLFEPGPVPRVVVCTDEVSHIVVTPSAGAGAQAADALSGMAYILSAMAAAMTLNLFTDLILTVVVLLMLKEIEPKDEGARGVILRMIFIPFICLINGCEKNAILKMPSFVRRCDAIEADAESCAVMDPVSFRIT
ncbi:hypothetical protein [Sodalis sp. RH16]|uniref:hypothetical protein n=1 Tax=unclassified Sodalis (in: enterobacteria) TaxID=2636512 RepID=UPI0039B3A85F